jgi:dihydroorotase
MADLLIKNGTLLDPSQGLDATLDLRLRDGAVAEIGVDLAGEEEVLDAAGLTVVPGLIDAHVHFREPGDEEEEIIQSGAEAAVAGGFTAVACMPNTDPAMDSEAAMSFVYLQAQKAGLCHVYPVGAITKGRSGRELAEMGSMLRGGAVAFTDDGSAVPTAGVLRRAMEYARMLDRPLLEHCEDPSLAAHGVMHEGAVSTQLGLPGIPAEAEEIVVARDIMLARLTGCRLHLQHVSTAGSVEQLRRAKELGVPITAEVTPHHLLLTHEDVRGYDPSFKMNPPLRTAEDAAACRAALREGVIDILASDHAPHSAEEKAVDFSAAAFGAIGLESTVGVLLTELVHRDAIDLSTLISRMTIAPARLLGLERGTLAVGAPADVTLLDPSAEWTIDVGRFRSRSRNCPFAGRRCRGRAVATVVDGRVVFRLEAAD